MLEFTSCRRAVESCMARKYFAVAHLYKEETVMNMHIHDCYEIYYSICGGKQFLIDNKFYDITPGDVFLINQYESHYLTQIDSEVHERIVLSVHPEYVKRISTDQTDLGRCFTEHGGAFSHRLSLGREQQNRFLYYIDKILSANGYGRDLAEQTAFTELLLMLNAACDSAVPAETPMMVSRSNRQVDGILTYINANIGETITLEALAGHFFLSGSYICRVFKSATGMTINRYITARRISIAKALLTEGLSVNAVCERCGYHDYSNFVKTFTKSVGLSPKKYARISLG